MKGVLKRLAIIAVLVAGIAAAPIVWIETTCTRPRAPEPATQALIAPQHHRNFVDTFLTYPEWAIVHAYEDFAALARERGETAFDYLGAVAGYWGGMCKVYGIASERGSITGDVRLMLHVIGLSFSAEMAVKGLWEGTIGRVTSWARGPVPTAEDRFALQLADDYAAFLRQTPWFEFPFRARLQAFWRETPFVPSLRSIERRVALSMEWGVKAIYASLLAAGAAAMPATLTIRSVVRGIDARDLEADQRIKIVNRNADDSAEIETPRYRAFTETLASIAARGGDVVEIAGQRRIFLTVIAPTAAPATPDSTSVLSVPIQSRPGFERRGVLVDVPRLSTTLRSLAAGPVTLEHIYDY